MLSTRKWADRKRGRGYGWITQKITKDICRPRDRVLGDHVISPNLVVNNRSPGCTNLERESEHGIIDSGLVDI